jgi:serine/threonine protein kinase
MCVYCGTPEYLAPEVVKNEQQNQMVDWWTFGVLLYHLMIGYPPFYHSDDKMMNKMII